MQYDRFAPQSKPGDALGPYRVDSLLGKGGMGEVYRGTDTRLGRPAAYLRLSGGGAHGEMGPSPDGKRFLFAAPPSASRVIPFTVVPNWTAGLKK